MLTLHFLNVGHGDCTFVDLPSGRLMMIDINNSESLPDSDVVALAEHQGVSMSRFMSKGIFESRSWKDYYRSLLVDPYHYYHEHFSGRSIFRYIQTHPDMDHMSGLHRFFWHEGVPLENFWDVEHNKTMDEDDFVSSPYAHEDWLVYRLLRAGKGRDDSSHKVIHNLRGSRGQYWTDDEIAVFSPTEPLVNKCKTVGDSYNDCSYVLKLQYAGRSVILPGDAEGPAWKSMLDGLSSGALDCDVLKAAHHGRTSGYDEDAVTAMSPAMVICSVGKKPETDASDEYRNHGADVLSTRYHGTITVTFKDNGEVTARNYKGEKVAQLNRLY